MIVLDTNVISAVTAESPDAAIVRWLDEQQADELLTTTVTTFELWMGVERLDMERRRDELARRTETLLSGMLVQPPLILSEQAARLAAALQGRRKRAGIVIDHRDAMIAGTCLAHGAALATRNIRHFADAGVTLVDPWAAVVDT
ncbi:PIN domain-containing protein [Niveispirillum sp. KHB5.9]|uniref:PIN domain-containing protein n=1 Tax=Niveispirillum sp. KHB5.9 TaxID=3400269 RepID=UPI003A84322D